MNLQYAKGNHKRRNNSGLRNLLTVTRYLGVDRSHADRLIELDGLPVVLIPTAKGIKKKVAVTALHRWLNSRSSNIAMSLDELQAELDRTEASTMRNA